MFHRCDSSYLRRVAGSRCFAALTMWLLLIGVAAAQDSASTSSGTESSRPVAFAIPPRLALPLVSGVTEIDLLSHVADRDPAGVRRITLQQAQQLAAGANPLVRLGQLEVEAAEQHRLGVKAQYFPSISGQFENLHLSEQPGQLLTLQRPFAGTTLGVPVSVVAQDQSAVNFTVIQPITPLFQVRQLVKIARADENIARAKAGMPVEERASLVEKNYFDLLVAERELVMAGAAAKAVQAKWVAVSHSTARASTEQQTDTLGAGRAWLLAAGRVKDLTASLADLLGLAANTRLELVPPEPFVDHLSLDEPSVNASAANTEVIVAEQTAEKAHAGSTLAKSAYIPSVAILGGWLYQTALSETVLPQHFAYVGVIATYTLFDSGKRERTVKEVSAQAKAADLGVELTRAKVAAAVKTSYLELERSRELVQLARRMVSAPRVVEASYVSGDQEGDAARAQLEAELFRAELEYRQAYARVKSLTRDK